VKSNFDGSPSVPTQLTLISISFIMSFDMFGPLMQWLKNSMKWRHGGLSCGDGILMTSSSDSSSELK